MTTSRRIFRICLALLIACAIVWAAVSVWLAMWIPTKGKAWLETQLEGHLPLDITIGTMRYSLWDGLTLEELSGFHEPTRTIWVYAPDVRARIGWARLLVWRELAFRIQTSVRAPVSAEVWVSGRYRLRTRDLHALIRTSSVALHDIVPPLAQYVPDQLTAGTIRVEGVQVKWSAVSPPTIRGRVIGESLQWIQGALQITTDATVEGIVTPASDPSSPLQWDMTVAVARGTVHGLGPLGEAREVAGTLRWRHDQLTIEQLQGNTLTFPWRLEGDVTALNTPTPRAELWLRAQGDLAAFAQQWAPQWVSWQPTGRVEATISCRGILPQWPSMDVMANVIVQDGALAVPRWPHRLETLNARLSYDHPTNRVTITSLTATTQGYPLSLHGVAHLAAPVTFAVDLEAEADLSVFQPLIPTDHLLQTIHGPVTTQLRVEGTPDTMQWDGQVTLSDATLSLRGAPVPIEHLSGTLRVSDQRLSTDRLTFVLQQIPVSVSATVTHVQATPRMVGEVRAQGVTLNASAIWHADRLEIARGTLTLGESALKVRASLSHQPRGSSSLLLSGTLDPADLSRLPWIDLNALHAWQIQGPLQIQLHVHGPLAHPDALNVQGAVVADALTIRGVRVQELNAELSQEQGRLTARVTRAKAMGGLVAGEYRLDLLQQPARYFVSADLTGIDLAQAAASIPAWQQQRPEGTASASLTLMGTTGDRTSLRGNGWVNATGTRLVDVPLLSRLLQGMLGALADRLGASVLRSAQITAIAGQWHMADQRVVTEDLRLTGLSGTEPIAIYARGSVGLDKTLDLTIEPELSDQLVLQAPSASTLSGTLLKAMGGLERLRRMVGRHRIVGTLDKPEYKFEVSLDQLLNQMLPTLF